MRRYNGNQPNAFEKINYMTLEQQEQVKKFIEEIEAVDKLTIPRIIIMNEDDSIFMRSKNNNGYRISPLGISPIKAFVDYMKTEQKLLIGKPMGQKVVEEIGSILSLPQELSSSVIGRSLVSGLPAAVEISSIQVRNLLLKEVFSEQFFVHLRQSLNYAASQHHISPEELAQASIILRGSLPNIRGLSERLQEVTGLKVFMWDSL